MKEKFLPIGTVCRLKDATKYLMIIGFCVSKEEEQNKVYDYIGCMYPQGMIAQDISFLFDHSQIDEILYEGFVNDIEKEFKQQLNLALKEKYGEDIKSDVVAPPATVAPQEEKISESSKPQQEQANVPTFNTLDFNYQDNNQ